MSGWLVVLLAGPLASFGEEPGNARRGSADRPTRSALLGLAGAALGVLRVDGEGQAALARSFDVATRTLRRGEPLIDFHTYQSLPSAAGAVSTRADALARPDSLVTTITRRHYRADGLWQAAFAERPGATFDLAALEAAMQRPHFTLWLGRKSCPLSCPLAPLVVPEDDVVVAFRAHAQHANDLWSVAHPEHTESLVATAGGEVAVEGSRPWTGNRPMRLHRRRDEPRDRERWHFATRAEHVFPMPGEELLSGGGS